MSPETFLDDLRAVLAGRSHTDLSAHCITFNSGAWELLIIGETVAAMLRFHQVLRDEEVCRHLRSWTEGDVLILVKGLGWNAPSPAALIRGGELHLVSNDSNATGTPSKTQNFAKWFERTIGAPLPFEMELVHLEENFWGTPEALNTTILGLPQMARLDGCAHYTLAGFSGYGSNSYAFYFTRVSGDTRMYLRVPYGGAYMDADKCREGVVGVLRATNRLFKLAVKKKLPMYLNSNMGDWYFAPHVKQPHSRYAEYCLFGDKAFEYVEGPNWFQIDHESKEETDE